MALVSTPVPDVGKPCPSFNLPATNGKNFSSGEIQMSSPFMVMFVCNHCPYVQAIEDRLIKLGEDFAKAGIPLIAISSNDAAHYPADSFEKMKERAEAKKYTFPYLYDESQDVAREFGAVCTPDFFGYDKDHKLAYRGRLDDSWKEAGAVTARELFETMLYLKSGTSEKGKHFLTHQTPSMGCSLKWKK